MEQKHEQDIDSGTIITDNNGAKTEEIHESHTLTTEEIKVNREDICTWRLSSRICASYCGMAAIGIAHALLGNILLELQIQTGAGIEKLALLFTWNSLGRLAGSFLISVAFDRLHQEMQLAIATLLVAASTSVIPLSNMYIIVSIAITLQGFFIGFISTGNSAIMFTLTKDIKRAARPIVQATYFAFSVGCVFGPVIAEPFLTDSNTNQTIFNHSDAESKTNITSYNNSGSLIHTVFGRYHSGTLYPTMISSVCFIIPFIMFLTQFAMDKFKVTRNHEWEKSSSPAKIDKVALVLLLVAFFSCLGIEVVFNGLLYAYVVTVHHWGTHEANHLVRLSWIIYSVCRLLGIPVAWFVKPHLMLIFVISTMLVMLILMASASHLSPVVLWVTTGGMGLSISIQLGTWFLLGHEYLPVTGRIAGYLMASAHTGCMAVPALIGVLAKQFTLNCFPLVLLAFTLLLFATFISLRLYGRFKPRETVYM